jgi:hypothetical protein
MFFSQTPKNIWYHQFVDLLLIFIKSLLKATLCLHLLNVLMMENDKSGNFAENSLPKASSSSSSSQLPEVEVTDVH